MGLDNGARPGDHSKVDVANAVLEKCDRVRVGDICQGVLVHCEDEIAASREKCRKGKRVE